MYLYTMDKTKELYDLSKISDSEIIKSQNIEIGKLKSEIDQFSFENRNLKSANDFCTMTRQTEFKGLQATLKTRNNKIKKLEENYIILQGNLRKQTEESERLKTELYNELKKKML